MPKYSDRVPTVRNRLVTATAAALLFASPLSAQLAAPTKAVNEAAPPPFKEEEAVVLSPFRVISDDKGYQAANTMSGSRLNTKLEDVFSSITVVTKQQMIDTAVLDMNDVFKYEASTEGTANFTLFSKDQNGNVSDKTSSDPQRANRIRGLSGGLGSSVGANSGGVNTAWGNFASNGSIPFDLYNVEAVEISRGPNSSLFGIGQPNGTVNIVPTQANLRRLSFNATLRGDSWGGSRESVNVNVPLFPGKLALRVASVNEDKGFTRSPASEKIHREFATLLAQPFKTTTIRISAENYHNKNRRPGALTPIETISTWKANGSPSWDPLTSSITYKDGRTLGPIASNVEGNVPGISPGGLPIGLTNVSTSQPDIYFDNNGPQFFTVQRTGNATTGLPSPYATNSELRYQSSGGYIQRYQGQAGALSLPLYAPNRIGDKSIYDWSDINVVGANHQVDSAKTISAELEQVILNTPTQLIAARAGWFRQDYRNERANWLDNNITVNVDVNTKLLDGRPNPFYLRPYVETTSPNPNYLISLQDIQNADLTYQYSPHALPKLLAWFGQQRLAAHGEVNRQDVTGWTRAPYFNDLSKVNWQGQTAANYTSKHEIGNRFYLGAASADPRVQYGAYPVSNSDGTYPLTWFNNNTQQWQNDPLSVALLEQSGNHSRNRTELRSLSYSEQGFFFDGHLVTTVGYRRDRLRQRGAAGSVIDPATGLVNYTPNSYVSPWFDSKGETKTYGAVAKATKWLSFSGGYSDSVNPRPVFYDLTTLAAVNNPHGFTKEYGVSFNLLEGKLYLKLNRYTTKTLGDQGTGIRTLGNRTLDNLLGRSQNNGQPGQSTLRYFAEETVAARFRAQNVTPSSQQSFDAVAKFLNLAPDYLAVLDRDYGNRINTIDSVDTSSRGYELELTYNPTRNWRIKLTGSKATAQDDRIGTNIYDFWINNVPFWSALRYDSVAGNGDAKGALWWSTPINTVFNTYLPNASQGVNNDSTIWANRLYTSEFIATYKNLASNVGKPRSQEREYHFAAVTNYDFTRGPLKNFNIGGAVRLESKAAIGFLAGPAETSGAFTGAVLELDSNKPVYDKARSYFDFSAGYRLKFFRDKISTKIQLNIQDAFENGRLQAVAVNPDGRPYAYRIVDPRRFVLSMSFDL
jgi:outer membrane receptor protein involved in Fe transport